MTSVKEALILDDVGELVYVLTRAVTNQLVRSALHLLAADGTVLPIPWLTLPAQVLAS